jgi:hypothetical protein
MEASRNAAEDKRLDIMCPCPLTLNVWRVQVHFHRVSAPRATAVLHAAAIGTKWKRK